MTKQVFVNRLRESALKAENLAQFGKPIEKADLVFLAGNGLQAAAHRASSCMGWIWRQWLLGGPEDLISKHVGPFIDRGLELRKRSQSYDYLALHDLYLLHCAIFATSDSQLEKVAERVADASGDNGKNPLDNGELYAAAWCGMMKYWILGDQEKATEQSEFIWGAYRERGVAAAPKPLVMPWLNKDWKAFVKCQHKDFEKLWNRARKDCWTVKAENSTEIVVTTEKYEIGHQWCWAHCGMALLANRQGVDVATDPFWFPAHALFVNDTDATPTQSPGSKEQQQELF